MIKVVLFDLDGVLVNMPDGHYESLNKALELFGARIEMDEHLSFFNGLPTKMKVVELEKQGRLPEGLLEFINTVKQKYTKEIIPKFCVPDYSKIVLLKALNERGIRVGCCSNSIRETLHLMLRSAQIFDCFDIILGNDEVMKSKPDPEIYITAMERLHVRPDECIIVEDSPHGIEAAEKSGAHVFRVRNIEDVSLSLFGDILKQ
jgi:beta-phosphoglucomutase